MHNAKVVILLSTYNGEQYLRQLLDSLYQQTWQDFYLLVRDDGSTDTSVDIIKDYAGHHTNLMLLEGRNIGVIKSFVSLLKACPTDLRQYYAFCDQDDVWKPTKLSTALKQLTATPNPAASLYCSRLDITDQQLHSNGLSAIPIYFGFENALVENAAIGCTQVFGQTIKQLILEANPKHMMMHDWWAYLVATGFGQVIYDAEPSIYYRQHAANVVGADKNLASLLKKSVAFMNNLLIQKNGLESLNQAQHFLNTYPSLSAAKRTILKDLLHLKAHGTLLDRYRFLTRHAIKRNHKLENLILTLTILAGLH